MNNNFIKNLEDLTDDIQQNEYLNSKDTEQEFENNLLNHALHYAQMGYPVFPVHSITSRNGVAECSCTFWKECSSKGKHPVTSNGFKDATTDENKIIDWWEENPNANIGLVTGIESGIFVLDIDTKYGGEQSLLDLQEFYQSALGENYEYLPATLTVNTGSGGRHLYFKYPLEFQIRGSVGSIDNSLDIRANGGYVIAPPSNHITGRNYQWFGVDIPIEDAPNWLLYEILKADQIHELNNLSPSKGKSTVGVNEKIKEGHRQKFLFGHIRGLINSYPREEVLRRALELNKNRFEPSFSEQHIKHQVDYVFKKYGKVSA